METPETGRLSRRRIVVLAATTIAVLVTAVGAWVGLVGGRSATPTVALGPPRYHDETGTSGVAHTYGGGDTTFVGGGIAVFDCDDDGLPDLYIAGGSNPAALYRNTTRPRAPLDFALEPGAAGSRAGVMGAYPLDIDGDGNIDLAVLRDDGAELLRGMGGCRFESGDDRWSFAAAANSTAAFSATWEGSAALPTMAFGKYVETDAEGNATYECPDNELFRPDPAGSGYAPAIALTPGFCSLSMLFSDWDASGRRDLRVSNDRQYYDAEVGEEQLWRMAVGEPPRLYTADDGWVSMQIWGMGIASYDMTGDGYPEVYLTSQGPNKLQTLLTGPEVPTYRDIAIQHGVIATRPSAGGDPLPSTAWHPEFQDVNNDGFIDLFVSKGNVNQQADYAAIDPSDLFLGARGGTFTYAAEQAGIFDPERGRGAALTDLNADGLLDLVQVDLDSPVRLWRNVGAGTAGEAVGMGHWLGLRVRQPGPNRDAIGALLEMRVGEALQRRELTVGGGHVSGQLGWTHVGLGPAARADVRVTWPDGEVGPWVGVEADQFATITRGSDRVEPWVP